MDAMDILGAMLGRKSGSGSSGGNVLKDILSGGRSGASPPSRRHPQAQDPARRHPANRRPRTIGEAAKSLEDLLNVSTDHHQQRRKAPASPPPSVSGATAASRASGASSSSAQRAPANDELNEQAEVLVRAMINAAKSDGQVDRQEQDQVIKQLGDVSQNDIRFLREEFAKPLDVREFTWSVPRGMEEQVYSLSLLAIDLDEQREAEYLADLAHGLRLDTDRCNAIHQRYGAPVIFRS